MPSTIAAAQGEIGSVLDLTRVENINAVQAAAVNKSRLHIPLIFSLDVIHGYRTMFAVPLAEASSWIPRWLPRPSRWPPRDPSPEAAS